MWIDKLEAGEFLNLNAFNLTPGAVFAFGIGLDNPEIFMVVPQSEPKRDASSEIITFNAVRIEQLPNDWPDLRTFAFPYCSLVCVIGFCIDSYSWQQTDIGTDVLDKVTLP